MKHVERPCGRLRNGQVSEFTEMSHFKEPQKAGHGHGVKWTFEFYASESSQVPIHLEMPRESTLGQKAVD